MQANALDAVVLRRIAGLAWITGGASTWVNTANGEGPVTAVITADAHLLFTNNIEAPRLIEEERLPELGWTVESEPWFGPPRGLRDLIGDAIGSVGHKHSERLLIGTDVLMDLPGVDTRNIGADIARLRARLLPAEQERAAALGADAAAAMAAAVDMTHPGQTEFDIASHIWRETQRRGIQAIVTLVATDERVRRFRHPLPVNRELERYAMLVLCGRRSGLVTSMTRLVHFGTLPEDLERRSGAIASIDARMIAASIPGTSTGEILEVARAGYAETGFAEAWRDHHQGGVIGYEPREYLAVPGSPDRLQAGMTCTWNPSVPGAKSEDTILVGDSGPRILTEIPGWPLLKPVADGPARPAILVR